MFRMWIKLWKDNHLLKDMVYENEEELNRTAKIFKGITESCQSWDLAEPIWLPLNVKDFKAFSRVKFYKDSYIETIDFDYYELQVIEED